MKLLSGTLIGLLVFSSAALSFGDDPVVDCTEDARLALNDLMLLVESFEKAPFNPCYDTMKALLASSNRFLNQCLRIQTNLNRYQKCIDELKPLFPLLRRLIDDVNHNRSTEVVSDVSKIFLIIGDKIYPCIARNEDIWISIK